jgi:hypothetical protein
MRIRLYRAWASNNSGAYVLLGSFASVEATEAAVRDLEEGDALTGPHAIDPAGSGLRWEVLGAQVLIEGYAAGMPPIFCAWVAKHGGHVQTELIHAHGPVVLRAHAWVPGHWIAEQAEQARRAEAGFVEALDTDPELAALLSARAPGGVPRRIEALPREHGGLEVVCAPHHGLVEATRALRRLAREHGLELRLSVFEWTSSDSDPAEVLALDARREWLTVAIDEVGDRPDELRKALLEVVGIAPQLVDAYLQPRAPVLQRTSRAHAEVVVRLLRQLGAKAHVRTRTGERLDV